MMKSARPFIPKINNSVNKIRTGGEVPLNGVNLSHYYAPPLTPVENIVIGDNTIFTLSPDKQEFMMYADTDYILKDETTNSSVVGGELIDITDKFFGDIPLYYCHKLEHKFYGETSLMTGMYFGDSIVLEDIYGNSIPTKYRYIIYLKRVSKSNFKIDTGKYVLSQLYDVYIYTSFQIENNFKIRCKYNALVYSGDDYTIIPSYKEAINPQPFFKKAKNVLETIENSESYYMQKSPEMVRSSLIHIGSKIKDPRNPQLARIMLEVTFDDNTVQTIYFPENEEDRIKIYNKNSIIDSEKDMFDGDKQIISKLDIASYFEKKGIIKVTPYITQIDIGMANIEMFVRPDGLGKLYVKTTLEQSSVPGSDIKKLIEKDGEILTRYAIKMKDRKPIKLLHPRETSPLSSWYIRVQNGKYSITDGESSYHYFIPEYYNQVFDSKYGYPYKRVEKEKPEIISDTAIKVKCAPLFVGEASDIKVYKRRKDDTLVKVAVESWNNNDGVINLSEYISDNDRLEVDYIFEEDSFIYTGYTVQSETNSRSICLDCNPNKHHYVSKIEDGSVTDVPTFTLLDKIVYVYIKPAIVITGADRIYNNNVIMHSFEKLSEEELKKDKLQLIGMIYIRPNSSFYSLEFNDSRSNGGGVTDAISDELRRLLEPESDYYWDIGYWDGEPFNECGVVIIKIDKNVLVKNGGHFTESEVEAAVNKHLAYGTLAIIEYVTTYNYEDITVKELEVVDYTNEN